MPENRFVRSLALAAAAAPIALLGRTASADRVDTFVALGKTATATVTASGDVATVGFVVPDGAGRKLSVLVKPAKKSPLALDVRLVGPDGAVVDPTAAGGRVKATTKLVSILLPDVPAGKSGLWRVEVRGADGTAGACTVTVKGKDGAAKTGGEVVPAGGTISVPLAVGSNQALTLSVRRGKGAALTPRVRILDPYGNPLGDADFLAVGNPKTGTLALKAYRLPVFGTYTLSISGLNNTGGAVTYAAKTAPAKAPKNGPVAAPGLPSDSEPTLRKTLDGTGSRPAGGGQLEFLWSQVAGPPVALTGADTATPSFTSPATGAALAFELAVAEGGVWSPPAAVSVEVGRRPLADAGRSFAVATGAAVTLDGTGSRDRRGSGLTYTWEQHPDDAVQVTLTGADTATPGFTAPNAPTVLRFGLVVDDGSLRSFEDLVTVRVGDAGQPVPDAGRGQVVARMATVHLSALATRTPTGARSSGCSAGRATCTTISTWDRRATSSGAASW